MPRDGTGIMARVHDWTDDAAVNIPITASRFDDDTDDIANELTNSLALDGQSTMGGNIKMGAHRITGMANGAALTDGATVGQVQNGAISYAVATGSSNAYAITLTPAVTSYVAGQAFTFQANFTNTGAATLNVNSLGAKTIKREGSTDLRASDIANGQIVTVIYDGTNFQTSGLPAASNGYFALLAFTFL